MIGKLVQEGRDDACAHDDNMPGPSKMPVGDVMSRGMRIEGEVRTVYALSNSSKRGMVE